MSEKYPVEVPEPKSRKGKVSWTDAEEEKIVELTANMRLSDITSPLVTLFERAQQQLPEHRRRCVKNIKNMKAVADKVTLRLAQLKARANAPLPPPPAPAPRVPTQDEVLSETPLDRLLALSISRLVGDLGKLKEIEQGLTRLGRVESLLSKILICLPSNGNGGPHKEPQTEVKRKKIAILGLLNSQMGEIQKSCGGLADLHFVSKDVSAPSVSGSDCVVLMANFISHGMQEQVYSQVPRDKVFLHHGGLSTLKELLERIS